MCVREMCSGFRGKNPIRGPNPNLGLITNPSLPSPLKTDTTEWKSEGLSRPIGAPDSEENGGGDIDACANTHVLFTTALPIEKCMGKA